MADTKTSAESAAATLTGPELVRGVQSSANVKITVDQIRAYVIAFPATAVPSADPNTLDDYEEGTFTPTLGDGTNNYTLNTANGLYTKIGNRCTAWLMTQWTSVGSAGAGQLRIGTLPFAPFGFNMQAGFVINDFSGLDTLATLNQLTGAVATGASAIFFRRVADNAASVILPANSSSASGTLCGHCSYMTA